MATFAYQARTAGGASVSGKIEAATEREAASLLRRQGLSPVTVKKAGILAMLGVGGEPRANVKLDDIVLFTRQLATMIVSGIPLLEALEIMQEQVDDKGFKSVLGKVINDIRSGTDFSEALSHHPKIFTRIYVNMIRAGEASGQLDEILNRLAEYQEAAAALKREIKSAMTYPVISLCMVFAITIFLLIGIVPKFKDIFTSMGIKLNPLTNGLLIVSTFMQQYWYVVILGPPALVIAAMAYRKTEKGRRQFDWLFLNLPIFGPLFQKVALSRFSRTFSTLIKSGVPILGALEIVANTAGNVIISDAVLHARDSVRKGENLAKPLGQSKVFPPMVVRMISVGEKSGALETLLSKISEFYDQQVQATVEGLTSLIEPLMIGLMGVIVGGIVLAVFLPIFQLQKMLTGG
ncbi:MAG: type II secretion system F family protein [Planctomycetota bacterium]